jgi:membrane protein DedA with SNARE-associated domain
VNPQLPGFLHTLAPYLGHYGYYAVFLIVIIESFGPPLPGETIIIAASIYAANGQLNIYAVGIVAFAAATIGDTIAYVIGRQGGSALINKYGKYVGATRERYAKTEDFFERHGGKIVIVARFIEGLRQLNGLVAGTTRMHYLRFLAAQVTGALIWVVAWTTIGYTAGSHITPIYDAVTKVGYALLAVAVVALLVWFVRRRRAKTGEPTHHA